MTSVISGKRFSVKKETLARFFVHEEEGNVKDQARMARDFRVYKVELCSVDSFSVALVASYIHIQAPFTSWPHRLTIDIFDTLSRSTLKSQSFKISSPLLPLQKEWNEKKSIENTSRKKIFANTVYIYTKLENEIRKKRKGVVSENL